ncbi:hypothetical protein PB2503_01997 [Parvularcula bermudensis HTCC2503]|uniref:UPF0262 protein PB2503_01997 n=1 Tax=Parvularcula bermudensis (strain ATCC BAA-594 / HTCC2503 / KCTC 12087) TaxID=314260 RepID=E0TBY5_PARBH|nr:UPF0262 family protein [Parvularcula bermudensis]ADM08478.1 hypothetical protein PB2503_01997 [Parvularcula bermudensis HTCC2503]
MTERLVAIDIDEGSLGARSSEVDHERKVAMHDLLEENRFAPVGGEDKGPYRLKLFEQNGRLVFDVSTEAGDPLIQHHLSMTPFRRLIKDYFMLCETYYDAIRAAMPEKLETVDMARRSVHNEATELLQKRLEGKISTDFDTARRLFTLICSISLRASSRGDR